MGNDHNQMMNELERQRRVLEEIRDVLTQFLDRMAKPITYDYPEGFAGQREEDQPTSGKS